MSSNRHDFIVAAVVRKMRQDGFLVTYLDGKHHHVSPIAIEIPPAIINHRPDAIGEKLGGYFAIGEAKSESDLFTIRTKNQLQDFIKLIEISNKDQNRLYIGVPLTAEIQLQRLLCNLGIYKHPAIKIIRVPEVLMPHEED